MKQFYINTNKACVLNLIWGGKPQPLIKTSVKVYIIHTFVCVCVCVCEYINSPLKYSMKLI